MKPTPEMIEAAARRLTELEGLNPDADSSDFHDGLVWEEYKDSAEAILSAALSVQPAAAVVGEPVASLETLQYYRDVHSDKFGWVKAPIRVVEDACGTLELLVAENAKFRKALAKIAEHADDNLPMYTPGAMVHTAEEALGGKP